MSRSVDLFIASPKPIEELARELAHRAEMPLTPGPMPGTWALDQGTVHAELRAHPYVDDGELAFERYQYALSARVGGSTRPTESAEAKLLRVVSEALRKGQIASMLVHDLQYREGPGQEEDGTGAGPATPEVSGPADPSEPAEAL